MTTPNAPHGKAALDRAATEGKKKAGTKAAGATGKKGKGKGKKQEAQHQQTTQAAEKATPAAAPVQSSLLPERAAAPKESTVKESAAGVSLVAGAADSSVAISDVAPLTFAPSPLGICAESAAAVPPTTAPTSTPAVPPSPSSRVAAAISAAAKASAAAALQTGQQQQQQEQKEMEFELYHKSLTSQMTFDEEGNPILVPLKAPASAPLEQQLTTAAPSTGVAITTEEAEGQFEAVPPPAGSCAGLCPPYGSLPESMSVKEHMGKAAEIGGRSVCADRVLSLYSLPSKTNINFPQSRDISCPQTLVHYLPPSPFVNRNGTIGVDIFAIKADFTASDMFDSIPEYVELSTNAQPELRIKRAETLSRSTINPTTLEIF